MAKSKNNGTGTEPVGSEGSSLELENDNGGNDGSIGGIAIVSPTEASGSSIGSGNSGDSSSVNSGSAKRGRGRPPGSGSKNKTTSSKKAVNSVNLEHILYSAHMMLSKALKVEELELDRDEAKLLGEAMHAVQSQYDFVVDPKVLAWMGLIGAAGTVYGPRIASYKIRKQLEKEKQKEEKSDSNIHSFPNVSM